MKAECWVQWQTSLRTAFSGDDVTWFQWLMVVPVMALLAAVLLAPLLRRAYSQRVQRYMGFRETATPPQAWWQRQARQWGARAAVADDPLSLAECMRQRETRVRRATIAAWLALVAGSLLIAPFLEDMAVFDIGAMVLFAAVLAAGPALVNLRPEGSKTMMLVGAASVTVVALLFEQELDAETVIVAVVLVGVLYLASVHRTMRAAVVPLTILCAGALLGAGLALLALTPAQCMSEGEVIHASDWALVGAVLAVAVGVFVACLWLSARVMDGLLRLVQRGWLSDISVTAGSGMLIVVAVLVLATDSPRATPAVQGALLVGWAALVAGAYAVTLWRQPSPRRGRRLLMLRVFSHDRKAERLLDAVQARWQLAGPVLEIGGPDLVLLNLDIEEFIRFVTFRLHELFQPAAVAGEVLAHSLDLAPDREGRFRVNELFCFDTSWKAIVEQLLGLADVVLLDLRGFNRDRGGTAHEVERLGERGLLPRVVAVGDAHTDWAFFDSRVAGRGPAGQALARRVDASDPQALQQCLDALVERADLR